MLSKLIFILSGNEFYPDFIASTVSMNGINKSLEVILFAVGAMLSCAVGALIERTLSGRTSRAIRMPDSMLDRGLVCFFVWMSGAALLSFFHSIGFGFSSFAFRAAFMLLSFASLFFGANARLFHASQILIPLLICRYASIEYTNGASSVSSRVNGLGLAIGVSATLALLASAILEAKRANRTSQKTVFFSTVVSIAVFFAFHLPKQSPLALDDYHTGEMIVPFSQFADFSQKRFVDFVSVHGELASTYGAVHRFFLDGTIASVSHSMVLVSGLITFFIAALLALLIGGRLAIALAIFSTPVIDRFYLVPVFFLVALALNSQISERLRSLSFAAFNAALLPFALLFNPASGMALIMASIPTQWAEFSRSVKSKQSFRSLAGPIIATLIAVAILRSPLKGVLQFIRDNGEGTLQAFGLPVGISHSPPSWLKNISSPALRDAAAAAFKAFKLYGWMVGLSFIAFTAARTRKWRDPLFLAAIIVPIALTPYTLGRVGQEGLDRVGAMGVMVLGFFLPVLAARKFRQDGKFSVLFASLIVLALGIRSFGALKDFHEPMALASKPVEVEKSETLVDSQALGLPRLGSTFVNPERLEELKAFTRVRDRETQASRHSFRYIDLTNRQVYFFLLDSQVAQLYPSHLLAINSTIQSKMIDSIERSQVSLAWISPSHDHEAATFPLRAYHLYRHLLIDKKLRRIETEGPLSFLSSQTEKNPSPEKTMSDAETLRKLWFKPELGFTASAWAKSEKSLRSMLERTQIKSRIDGASSGAWRATLDSAVAGSAIDMLEVRLEREHQSPPGRLTLSFDQTRSFQMNTTGDRSETLFIPIGADPAWLLGEKHSSLAIETNSNARVVAIDAFLLRRRSQ